MESANDNAKEAGAALVSEVLRELGPAPVPADQLAALIGLRLEPYADGAPVCPDGEAIELGYAGAIAYDATLPTPAQERVLALACARFLVSAYAAGDPDSDHALVEYVACALCGIPRGVVGFSGAAPVQARIA